MVEQHVGKKRRKEVRQAIRMNEEMRKLLVFSAVVGGVGLLAVLVSVFLPFLGIIAIDPIAGQIVSIVFLVLIMLFVIPKANRYWSLRDELKVHCDRFNISKEDMQALKGEEA